MAVRCKINGNAKLEPTDKGACPECLTPDVPTTGKGFVGAHDVKLSLGEGPQVPVTDEGTRVGDPRDAAVRRELDAIEVRKGDVAVPSAETDPVEATGHGRAPVLVRGRAMEPFASEVTRGLVGEAASVSVAGSVMGPEPGQTEIPVSPEVWGTQLDGVRGSGVVDTRKGWSAQTMNGPTGREHFEPEVMHGGRFGTLTRAQYDQLSRTQQRKYWDKIKRLEGYVKTRRATLVRVPVQLGTGGVGSSSFADHTSRVTERIMREIPEH